MSGFADFAACIPAIQPIPVSSGSTHENTQIFLKNSCFSSFFRYTYAYGVLAQLGARNIRIVEATGSNPVYSIIFLLFKIRHEPIVIL